MIPEFVRNDMSGCWALGMSRDKEIGVFCIHFLVWHLMWNTAKETDRG